MTNEEAIEVLKNMQSTLYDQILLAEDDALEIAYKALEAVGNSDKYRWHDTRENPEDLPPKKYKSYLAYTDLYKYEVVDYYGEVSGEPVWSISQYDVNVIAWREIEPFEEEE